MPFTRSIIHDPTVPVPFNEANPIDFSLLDDEGQQNIYILNDQAPGRTHHLVIHNNSDQDLHFQSTAVRRRHIPAADNHHLELRFRPGTLDLDSISWIAVGTNDWRLHAEAISVPGDDIHDGSVSLYLLYYGEEDLVLGAGETMLLVLDHVKAGISGGSRGSRMELRYHVGADSDGNKQILTTELEDFLEENLLTPFLAGNPTHAAKDSDDPIRDFGQEMATALQAGNLDEEITLVLDAFLELETNGINFHYRQERLQVVSNRGKKELPLIAAFEGSNTVLNDGSTANNMTLQISNLLQNSTIRLHARDSESPTKFILSFDTSEEDAAWALCDHDNAAAIDVDLHFEDLEGTNWHIRPELQGENPQWIITLIDDIDILVGEYFHIHLDGLKTSMPSGFTTLYLLYENVPGFWDGRFEIPIEKSPLKFDDQKQTKDHRGDGEFIEHTKVGIGNIQPTDTLDVNGGVTSETLLLRNRGGADFPLDVTGDARAAKMTLNNGDTNFPPPPANGVTPVDYQLDVNGTIRAKGMELEGDLQGDITLNTNSLQVSNNVVIGVGDANDVTISNENGNVKVSSRLKDSEGFVMPKGGIIMWSGTTVPEGWKLCDGTKNTPNLSGRFIVGYQSGAADYGNPGTYSQIDPGTDGNNGGAASVTLTKQQMPSHSHTITDTGHTHSYTDSMRNTTSDGGGGGLATRASGGSSASSKTTGSSSSNITIADTGGGQSHENRPPYYVLAFIMKL
ncbi:MAG: hypothetical protein KDC70_00570 [Saprospiraceae bacterium]|nr:hypothetical protein [Saprospiraceae bacterium]